MCKLMVILDGSKIKSVKKTVNAVLPLITKNDKDGFGWYARGSNGAFGERMSSLHHGYRLDSKGLDVKLPVYEETYESFGRYGKINGPIVFHGRTSTNVKGLKNTHPISRNGWLLSHNGVVNNTGPSYKMLTQNDTEHLVHYMSTEGIQAIERHLTGYFAFAALDQGGTLHLAKDDTARLYVAWIETIQSHVFATTINLIESLCADMKWTHGAIEAVSDNIYMQFNGNDMLSKQSINPRGYSYKESAFAEKSLGRSIGSSTPSNVFSITDEPNIPFETQEDADAFLEACEYLDASCTITDANDSYITLEDFRKLDSISKLECVVKLADGTVLTSTTDFKAS